MEMAPDSRRSERRGSPSPRISGWRDSCDSAITGTFSSRARALRPRLISETSCTRLASRLVEAPSFDEAELILECRKTYFSDLDPTRFLDPSIESNYPARDYHRMYFGEIVAACGTAGYVR